MVTVSEVEEWKCLESPPQGPSLLAGMSFNSFWRCHGLSRPLSGYLSLTTSDINHFSRPRGDPRLVNILGNPWGAFLVEGKG